MMPARPVNMAMVEFFLGSISYVDNFYIEVEMKSSQWVIGVDCNVFIANINNGNC